MHEGKEIDTTVLFKRIDSDTALAKRRGLDKINEAATEQLARDLQGGVGPSHKAANADNDLPPLSLTLINHTAECVKNYIVDPRQVAAGHAKPWKEQWEDGYEHFSEHVGGTFRMLRNEYIRDAEFTAANLDVSAPTVMNIL